MAETSYDPKDVALAALTNLIRLMGAELVAGRHRDDLNQLERAVRAKIGALTVVGCPVSVADTGIALAKSHVERALTQIRAQVTDLKNATAHEQAGASDTRTSILQ
jgi:hypothetical protein